MTDRPKFYKDMTSAPDYNINYSLIDAKPKVALFDKRNNAQSNLTSTRALNLSSLVDLNMPSILNTVR